MPIMDSLLPEEDLQAYKSTREKTLSPELQGLVEEKPDWRESLEVMKYQKFSTNLDLSTTLSMSMFDRDKGRAADRRFSDDLDVHYLKPDGTFNQTKWNEDQFVISFEKAYYDSKGEVPVEFFLDHSEDLELLGGDFAAAAKQLHRRSLIEAHRLEVKDFETARFHQDVDFISEWQEVGNQEALVAWTNIDNIINSFGEDWERGQQALDEHVGGMNYRELYDMREVHEVETPIKRGFEYTVEETIRNGDEFLTRAPGDRAEEGDVRVTSRRKGYEELSGRRGDMALMGQVMQETLGTPMGWVAGGLGWGIDTFTNELRLPELIQSYGSGEREISRQEAVQMMEDEAGMDLDAFIVTSGFAGAQQLWQNMPSIDPTVHTMYMNMAGGDTQLAADMFIDAALFNEENMANAKKQQAVYNSKMEYQIKELEDENFTTGDALLNVIAAWGEALEFAATAVTIGLEGILTGDAAAAIPDSQFWQDVRDAETPAGVLGLEGTLVGLMLDLGATMAIDPTTYIFGPKLAAGGRAGIGSVDDAVRVARNQQSRMIRKEVIQVGRGVSENSLGYSAVMENMAATGSAETYMAATRGHIRPIASQRPYLRTPVANAVDDVSYSILADMMDDLGMDGTVLREAMERVKKNGPNPVVVGVNPHNGATEIISGGDDAAAIRALGHDAMPMTIVRDDTIGLVLSKNTDDWATRLGVVDGQIPTSQLEDLLRYDFRQKKPTKGPLGKELDNSAVEARKIMEEDWELSRNIKAEIGDAGAAKIARTYSMGHARAERLANMIKNPEWKPAGFTPEGAQQAALVKDVGENGVNKAIAIAVDPDTGAVTVINGNHRVSAALDAGVESVPVTVSFKRKLADVPGLEGRAAPKAPKILDDLPMRTDDFAHTEEWAKGLGFDDAVDVDGAQHLRPRRVLGDDIYDDVIPEVLEQIEIDHYLAGGDPIGGQRTVVGVSASQHMGDLLRNSESKFLAKLGEFVTPINSNFHFAFNGTGAMDQINQFGHRLYGAARDHIGFEPFQARILDFYKTRGLTQLKANKLTSEVAKVRARHTAVQNSVARFEELLAQASKETKPRLQAAHKIVSENFAKLDIELDELRAAQTKVQGELLENTTLVEIMDDMMLDYNKRHIATNPKWAKYVNEEGIVPWEQISDLTMGDGGRFRAVLENAQASGMSAEQVAKGEAGYLPPEAAKIIDDAIEAGIPVQSFVSDALGVLNSPSYWNAPASPLEMMTAAAGGPSAARRVTHALRAQQVMEVARNAQMYWALDKVLTPKTAIVVSLDELTRIGHLGGTKSVLQLMEDKAISLAKHTGQYNRMPQRWKNRLVALEEYPTFFRQLERSFLETNGYGFDVIEYKPGPKAAQYYEAAQRTTGQLLTDRGFQQFMKGEDSFRQWFDESTEASKVRDMEFLDPAAKGVRTGMTADMAYGYYNAMFERWALSGIKKGKLGEARKLWKEAAERQATKASTAGGPVHLPDWVLEGYGSVTGNVAAPKAGMGAFNMVSDALFQQPVNYRRGFMAEWVRKSERARLAKLYKSQGKQVMSDVEVKALIKRQYPTWSDQMVNGRLPSMRKELFERQGVITQSHMDNLVETKVISEMENALYSFQMNSRGGKAAKAVAPFGKPWADMMGFWGREVLSTPNLRGWVNQANYFNMDQIAKGMADAMPFNPKAGAFISRIAATDFELDRIQDDPLVGGIAKGVGLESLDVGPALFLPHEGANPFGVLLPGLGVIPVGALQYAFNHLSPDPVDDPLAYQAWIDEWSQFMPGIGNSQGLDPVKGVMNLVLGGGTANKTATGISAANSILGDTQPEQQPINGSWAGRIESNRYVKSIFTDVDIWEEFADLPTDLTAEGFTAWLDSKLVEVVDSAQSRQAWKQIQQLGTQFAVPVKADFGRANDQLDSQWIKGIEYMELDLPAYINPNTEQGKRQAADWARTRFFALPDWERDAIVAGNPGMAVNLVSMWEWTDAAKNQNRMVSQTDVPYRSGGSSADLARHETYQQLGYIQPVTPHALATNIVGTIMNAKAQTARQLYSETVSGVNDQRWEHNVSDEWKAWLEEAAPALIEEGELPYRTARELWENYPKLKQVYDTLFPPEEGETGFTLPQKQQAWSVEMPSDSEGLREAFEDGYPIPKMTPEMVKMAKGLGIKLERPAFLEGRDKPLEVAEIYHAVANALANEYLENPIYAHVAPGYKAWNAPRSAGAQATQEFFGRVLDSDVFDAEIRYEYKKNLIYIDETMERRAMNDSSWLDMREDSVNRFMTMMQDDAFEGTDYHELWNQAYGKTLGALDWAPPEPAPLMQGDKFNPDASQIFVSRVVDGDTLDFTYGGGILGGNEYNRLRLLGYNAAELGGGGEGERDKLRDAVADAVSNGIPVSVVRDPRFGNTDMFGRMYGWLYIGEEVWYDPSTMIPRSR